MKRKEFDLHSEIPESLKRNKIIDQTSTWGSCGPDIHIKGKGIIEIKPCESEPELKETYKQIIEREEWRPSNLHYFAIVTPTKIRVYLDQSGVYHEVGDPNFVFSYPKEREQFVEFLKKDNSKIKIEVFLREVLLDLHKNNKIERLAIIRMLINFDKNISLFSKGIIIDQGNEREVIIECNDSTLHVAKDICPKYYTENVESIR